MFYDYSFTELKPRVREVYLVDKMDEKRRGPHKRCAGYWREYDAKYRMFNKKTVFDWVEKKAEELGQPFTKRGGGRREELRHHTIPVCSPLRHSGIL